MVTTIPEVVVLRLPLYVRVLVALDARGQVVVSSQELGSLLHATPAQIRKDLSYFGRFGKQGRGYQVSNLLMELRHIMGIDREWSVVLVGVGQLGGAILTYGGFAPQGFNIVAAFDADPSKLGGSIGNVVVQDIARLKPEVQRRGVHIGIVAVPAAHCQQVVDQLVDCGVRAILNYAPYQPLTPPGVWVRDIDPVVALQSMTYHLNAAEDWGLGRV